MFFKLKNFLKKFDKPEIDFTREVNCEDEAIRLLQEKEKNIKFVNIEFHKRIPADVFINKNSFINCKFVYCVNGKLSFNECILDNVEIHLDCQKILTISKCRIKDSMVEHSYLKELRLRSIDCWNFRIQHNQIENISIFNVNSYQLGICENVNIMELRLGLLNELDRTEFYDNEYLAFFCTRSWHLKRILEDRDYINSYKKNHKWKALGWKWLGGNYGESVILFSIWPLLIFAVFSCFYYFNPQFFFSCGCWSNWFQPIYFSIVTFSTLGFGDIHPITGWGQFLVVIEVIFGYIFLGGIVSLFANKMIRKS